MAREALRRLAVRRRAEAYVARSIDGNDAGAARNDAEPIVEPIDPDTAIVSGNGDGDGNGDGGNAGTIRRGRGRPRGSGTAKSTKLAVVSYESLFIITHGLVAAFTQTPEIALTQEQGKALGDAMNEVSKHFTIPIIDPKWIAVGNLCAVMGKTYYEKAQQIRARKLAEAQAANPPQPTGPNIAATAPMPAPSPEDWLQFQGRPN